MYSETTKKVPVPPYLSRYDSGSRQSLTSMAENKNRLNDSRADSRQSLSKTKSISNLSVMSSSTRKMNKSKSTMNLASPSFVRQKLISIINVDLSFIKINFV